MARRGDLWQYYLILGLEPGASSREVKQAYRALVKKWHPDQFNHDPRLERLAEDKLKEINQAYAVLLNPDQSAYRRRYGRPSAGQQAGRTGSAGDAQAWSATGRPFHYQSSYYRTRQAKAAGGGSRRRPYASAYAAYASGIGQNRAPRWAITLVMFFLILLVNTFTSSMWDVSSSRSYASAPAQPAASSRPQLTGFIPIVTISEKELKEQKERESRTAAASGAHVPIVLKDPIVSKDKAPQKSQREAAAAKKGRQGPAQRKSSAPKDPSAGK